MRTLILASLVGLVGCGGSSSDPAVVDDTGTVPTDGSVTDTGGSGSDTGGSSDGGSDTTTPTDGTATDTGTPPTDAPVGDGSIKCGTATCTGGDLCCAEGTGTTIKYTCAKACADGGVSLGCTSPADCSGTTAICCADAEITGSGFACGFKGGSSACAATCKSSIPFGCPGKATVRLCSKKADCVETGYEDCCQVSSGGATTTLCISKTIAGALGAKCL